MARMGRDCGDCPKSSRHKNNRRRSHPGMAPPPFRRTGNWSYGGAHEAAVGRCHWNSSRGSGRPSGRSASWERCVFGTIHHEDHDAPTGWQRQVCSTYNLGCRISGRCGETLFHPIHEAFGACECQRSPIHRHLRIRPRLIVGNGLEGVGLRQETAQVGGYGGVVPGQSAELGLNTLMRLRDPASRLENQCLSGMEGGKIGVTSGIVPKINTEVHARILQTASRLVEISGGLWRQSSRPSRRISCIRGVRSA